MDTGYEVDTDVTVDLAECVGVGFGALELVLVALAGIAVGVLIGRR